MYKKNFLFALPLIASNLLLGLNAFALMWVISQLGHNANAAGSLIYSAFGLIGAFLFAMTVPVSIFVARAHGAKKTHELSQILRGGLIVVTLSALVVGYGILNMQHIFHYFGQPLHPSLIAARFFHGYLLALLPYGWLTVIIQSLNGISKTKQAMMINLANLLIVLPISYLLTVGGFGLPKLGILGCAYGLAVGYSLVLIGVLFYLFFSKTLKPFQLLSSKKLIPWQKIKSIYGLGVPICVQRIGEISALSAITAMVGRHGILALTALQAPLQFSLLVIMIIFGYAQTAGILSGQALGAGNPKKAKQQGSICIRMILIITACISLIFFLFPHALIHVFFNVNDPNLHKAATMAVVLLEIIAIQQLFDGVRNVSTGALRGYKDTKFPMIIGVLGGWVIGVPCGYLFMRFTHLGAAGLVGGYSLGIAIGAILVWCRLRHQQKKAMTAVY